MFTDPQSITYNSVAKSLAAVGRTDTKSEYRLNDAGTVYNLSIEHTFKARNRCVVRLRRDAYASDPLVPTQNILASMTATVTLDFPTTGVLPADVQSLANALTGFLSSANALKIVNGET